MDRSFEMSLGRGLGTRMLLGIGLIDMIEVGTLESVGEFDASYIGLELWVRLGLRLVSFRIGCMFEFG